MANRLDPRMKQTIRDKMRENLYQHVDRRFNETLAEIIERNTLMRQFRYACFTYKGVSYGESVRFCTNRLHPELHDTMDKLLKDREQIRTEEEPFIIGFFNRALNKSNSIQDYLLMFPDCMHATLSLFTTSEWKASQWWFPRELSDEQIAQFKEDHEPWLEKLRNRMMIDLILN